MVSSSMEITPIEMIKPSSPTPSHLKTFNLSFLDQLAPPIYIHLILYYEACHDSLDYSLGRDETSLKLKRSLSETMTTYYPLAGRIRDNSWVDCNDDGVEYVENQFHSDHLLDVARLSQIGDLGKYVPNMPRGGHEVPLAVQVNFFHCGGVAVGICMSHKLADAASLVTFVNAWASSCHTEVKTVSKPAFGLASRFPSADFSWFPPPTPAPGADGALQKILTKRYVFDKKTLTALKQVAIGPNMENPSRVESISAFIWKHYIEATTSRDKNKAKNTIYTATHAVDIRSRANPPLPRHVYGNACARAMAMVKGNDPSEERACTYHDLAIKLRHAIRKVDDEYVKKLENGDSFLKYYSGNEENDPCFKDGKTRFDICGFTSWFQLPAYETDYGWGKPIYVSIIGVPHKNLIFLLGTKSGDAIEAWVSMAEEDIAEIDTNYQLLCTNTHDIYESSECAPVNHLPTRRSCQEV